MSIKVPNTICKNVNCHNGAAGGRKHYYSCRYCTHTVNWRSVACSESCYEAYVKQVMAARAKGHVENLLPTRTDMTLSEVQALVHDVPSNVVIQQTKEELKEELENHPNWGYGEIVDDINAKLDAENNSTKKEC